MGYVGEQKRAYQLKWINARRDKWIAENGPCALCGSSNDLEVDHAVPRKVGGGLPPTQIWSRRADIRIKELARCQVLCKTCHRNKSNDELLVTEHGLTRYRGGCRCRGCREAHRVQMKEWRDSRRGL